MQDDEKGNMQMQDTCYLRGLLPPSWLTDRVEGNTHSAGRMLERPDTAFEAVPWWLHDLLVVVRDIFWCFGYVE